MRQTDGTVSDRGPCRRVALTTMAACFGAIGFVACGTPQPTADDQAGETTLTLQADNAGDLTYCRAENDCVVVSNPDQCASLSLTIDNATGDVCERCLDESDAVVSERCEGAHVACTLVTAPEPDCLVCAHIDGPVIFSSCVAAPPQICDIGPRPDGRMCETCYDANGGAMFDSCGPDCGMTACPEIACAEGFLPVVRPGDCCPQCLPPPQCDNVLCSTDFTVPECPLGTELRRDPIDCCGYFCAPNDCDLMMCPMMEMLCPPGHHLDHSPPHCCGICVPDVRPPLPCLADDDCPQGDVSMICSTSLGACLPPPDCDPAVGLDCATVCTGICQPADLVCPLSVESTTDATAPIFMPPAEACEGEWIPGRIDAFGCPLPPVCVCADGTVSLDGMCFDRCALVDCATVVEPCAEGFHLETGYPYCCGACVPNPPSPPPSCASTDECSDGFFCTTQLGDCQPSPECGDNTTCITLCYGVCMPGSGGCSDSDGLDPFVAGRVTGSAEGGAVAYSDQCAGDGHTLTEYWCYESPLGSGVWVAGQAIFPCDVGCVDGACVR